VGEARFGAIILKDLLEKQEVLDRQALNEQK
jgi:hypothetical protein